MKYFIVLLLSVLFAFAEELNIDELLGQIHAEHDLSKKTKQENVGHIVVFSRDDIERMRLRTLKDFIDYIPFVHYKINNYGFVDPYYKTATLTREAVFRVFIDDTEFYLPYGNNGLKVLANINLHFIDHAEVYFGVPSFTFGAQMSITAVKLYTKKPKRENASFVGIEASNKKSFGTNIFSARNFDDFSYLLNIAYADTKQPKTTYEDYQLSRDSDNANIFSKFDMQNHSVHFFTSKSSFDDFLGESQGFNVNEMESDNILFSGGYLYKNEDDLKINLSYTHSNSKYNQSTDAVLDVIPIKDEPFVFLPHSSKFHLQERVFDFGASRKYDYQDTRFLVGLKGRYKHAKVDNFYYENRPFRQKNILREDLISSLYTEISHSLSPSSLIMGSLKYDYITRRSLDDDQLFFAKLGYVYSNNNLYYKHYIFAGDLANQYYDFAFRAADAPKDNKKEDFYGTSAGLGYKTQNSHIALLARYMTLEKESIFLPFYNYLPYGDKVDKYRLSFLYSYSFSPLSKFDFNLAANRTKWKDNKEFSTPWFYGGYVRFLTSYKKLDISNALIFGFGDKKSKDFYSLNVALNYRHSRNLNFYIKANNIFDSGYKQNFNGFKIQNDRIEGIETLNNVKIFPREFFIGVEYLF